MKNDMQIQQAVLAELDRESTLVAGTVGVEVHHGVVKLAGRVADSVMRKNAETAARRVSDVTDIVMDIDVAGVGTVPKMADDRAHAARVA
jgi:osmotically-inducible protein OsmY